MSLGLGLGMSGHQWGLNQVAPPAAPTASAATNVDVLSFTANWEAVSGADSYRLDVSAASDFSSYVSGYQDLTVNGTSQAVSGLTAGTTYYYRVRAVNAGGTSGNSETTSVLTLWEFTLTKVGNGSVQQTIDLGNSGACTIYITDGSIVSVSAGTVAPDGKSATLTPIADSETSDYRTITFEALGATASATVKLSNVNSLHYLNLSQATNGAGMTYNGALPSGLTYLSLNGININWTYNGELPSGLTYIFLSGININWTYNGALPSGLTRLYLSGININWTYNGALPSGLTRLYLNGININWTYNGSLPSGLAELYLIEDNINWTYNGSLPSRLTRLYLSGININWTYNGALPSGLIFLYLSGNYINWTGLDIGNNGNIGTFSLINYRINKMSSADMVTLLTQMTNRIGTLPATITINDYADYASPPTSVTDAVAALKAAKSITTVNLGA